MLFTKCHTHISHACHNFYAVGPIRCLVNLVGKHTHLRDTAVFQAICLPDNRERWCAHSMYIRQPFSVCGMCCCVLNVFDMCSLDLVAKCERERESRSSKHIKSFEGMTAQTCYMSYTFWEGMTAQTCYMSYTFWVFYGQGRLLKGHSLTNDATQQHAWNGSESVIC